MADENKTEAQENPAGTATSIVTSQPIDPQGPVKETIETKSTLPNWLSALMVATATVIAAVAIIGDAVSEVDPGVFKAAIYFAIAVLAGSNASIKNALIALLSSFLTWKNNKNT